MLTGTVQASEDGTQPRAAEDTPERATGRPRNCELQHGVEALLCQKLPLYQLNKGCSFREGLYVNYGAGERGS